jgi:long-subunit fatty acid transport protein
LNQAGRIRKQGSIGKWSFANSLEVAKGLFIGGSFNILTGSYKSDSDFWEDDTRDIYAGNLELVQGDSETQDFQSFYLNDIIEWDLSGWDAQLGILYNWEDFFRFGAAVKFPSFYTIKETYFVDSQSKFGTGTEFQLNPAIVDKIQYEIKTPFEYSFGASLNLSILTFSGDVNLIDYTEMEFTKGFDSQYRIERKREIDDLFRTTINYKLGAEVKIPFLPIFGRIGAMYYKSPFADDPTKFDKKFLTAGAGIVLDDVFSVDVAYAYGWWEDFGDNYGVNQSRTFQDINVQQVILNISTRL